MMTVEYILKAEDMKAYYRAMLENDDAVIAFRWKLRLLIPAGTVVFGLFLGKSWILPLAIIAFAALWFAAVDHIIYPQYEKRVISGYMKEYQGMRRLKVDISNTEMHINGKCQKILRFGIFDGMTVAVLENGMNLIVPDRVFSTENEKKSFDRMLENNAGILGKTDI